MPELVDMELVEDRSPAGQAGFLALRRLTLRHRYDDGTASEPYSYDIVDRPGVDAVAVALYARDPARGGRPLVALCHNVRPPITLRRDLPLPAPEPDRALRLVEIPAGSLEAGDDGLLARAAEEVREEVGVTVRPEDGVALGGGFFPAPGTLSEKVYLVAFEVDHAAAARSTERAPAGDGSVIEADARLSWRPLGEVLDACARGEIEDAKTEIALRRLAARLGFVPELDAFASELPAPWPARYRTPLSSPVARDGAQESSP